MRAFLALAWMLIAAAAAEPPSAIPTVGAAEVSSATDPTLLPLTLPGYELRVLDRRKPLALEAGGARFEVRLPIFFYVPSPSRAEGLRRLRLLADDLRRACRAADRGEVDLEGLSKRLEAALAQFGP